MAVYRRKDSEIWHFEFIYRGQRVRGSTGEHLKTLAVAFEQKRRRELERINAGLPAKPVDQQLQKVSRLLDRYAANYKTGHRQTSITMIQNRSEHLKQHLGNLFPSDLTEDRIRQYQADRTQPMKESAPELKSGKPRRRAIQVTGRTVNLEIQILAAALDSTWKTLWPKVKRLEENHEVGRALEAAEERAILDAAARNESPLIHPFLYTLAWTGMRKGEARNLRWSDVDFESGEITLLKAKAKTRAGKRGIPMSGGLRSVLEAHAAWCASKFGALQPEWYVFPSMNRRAALDPRKPVTSIESAWNTVREAAGVDCRIHDLRHTFCTKLGEAGTSERTMLDIMGHMSKAMLDRYSHIRKQSRRAAIDAVEAVSLGGVPTVSPTVTVFEASKSTLTH